MDFNNWKIKKHTNLARARSYLSGFPPGTLLPEAVDELSAKIHPLPPEGGLTRSLLMPLSTNNTD